MRKDKRRPVLRLLCERRLKPRALLLIAVAARAISPLLDAAEDDDLSCGALRGEIERAIRFGESEELERERLAVAGILAQKPVSVPF